MSNFNPRSILRIALKYRYKDYIMNLFLFPSLITGLNVKSVMIDTFSREQFLIQVRYFKAFYNRASQTQKEYIKRSLLVSNLVKYLYDSSIQ